jgi:hypothetical protein
VLLLLAACNDPSTGSNAVLAPESPLTGTVVAVDQGDGTFIVETSDGEQVSLPIGDQRQAALHALRRSADRVEVTSELRNGRLSVISVRSLDEE